ncbi:hypothetical protein SpCBS45565_g04152 [Spizellomyces sp. 'palustris']|nr:hypothetical protein SpCBS45565_g04152 [Spizellomyces sp. 'palustris']
MPPKSHNQPQLPPKTPSHLSLSYRSSSSHLSGQGRNAVKNGSKMGLGRVHAGGGKRTRGAANGERERDVIGMINDQNWKDRLAKELKSQREWSERWGCLVDPLLYLSNPHQGSWKPQAPPHNSPFNIINPPGKNVLPNSPPPTPPDYIPATYKVTGDRSNYLSGSPNLRARPTPNLLFDTTSRPTPAEYTAPFATATPVSQSSLPKQNRGTLPIHRKHQSRPDPQAVYKYPPSTNTEYGWAWGGMRTLEIYGSTNANFVKEGWKRLAAKGGM